MFKTLSPNLIRRRLISLFPAELEDIARERDDVQRYRTIDITALVWTLILGFAVDGPMRPDHVPTMAGEDNANPGYHMKDRLFAIGYMRGLLDSIE